MPTDKGFKFEQLRIWQEAMELGENVHHKTKEFPGSEKYNLSSQIRLAADSIALNISEGSILQSKPEFKKFMGYSARSLAEVVTCLHKARNRNYLNKKEFQLLYDSAFKLMNMIVAFRNKI